MQLKSNIPSEVKICVKGPKLEGLCVCLKFEMRTKNNFSYFVFLDSNGIGSVSDKDLLKVFDEERRTFIMDYDDPRIAFTGNIAAKVLNAAEIVNALKAFQMFQGKLSFPDSYEKQLKLALENQISPEIYKIEIQTIGNIKINKI